MAGKRGKTAMTKRRKWDAKTKAMIVMDGLRGTPVADICTEYQISQVQYYQWQDQFMKQMPKVLRTPKRNKPDWQKRMSG